MTEVIVQTIHRVSHEIKRRRLEVLRVVNGGPAVPEPVLRRLTERFVRGNSETSGSGLGLAIAKTIVQGVNARIRLLSPATGRTEGFEVCVWFVLAANVEG